jgi:hypothetical protein
MHWTVKRVLRGHLWDQEKYLYDMFVWGIIYQLHINSKYSNLKLEKNPAQLNKMTSLIIPQDS